MKREGESMKYLVRLVSPLGLGSEFGFASSITKATVVLRTMLLLCKLRVGATMVGVFMLAFSGMAGAEGWKKIEIAGEVPLSFETVSDIKINSGIDEDGFVATIYDDPASRIAVAVAVDGSKEYLGGVAYPVDDLAKKKDQAFLLDQKKGRDIVKEQHYMKLANGHFVAVSMVDSEEQGMVGYEVVFFVKGRKVMLVVSGTKGGRTDEERMRALNTLNF